MSIKRNLAVGYLFLARSIPRIITGMGFADFPKTYKGKEEKRDISHTFQDKKVKVKVSHSLIAVGAVGVRVPLYLGHS